MIAATAAATLATSTGVSARPWGWGPPRPYYGGYYRHRGCGGCGFLLGAGIVGAIALAASADRRDREIYVDRSDPPPAPPPPVYYPEPPVYEAPPPPPPPQPRYDSLSARDRDAAVDNCKVAAEREGERYSSRVRVDQIEDVRAQREGGYRVTGVVAIDHSGYNGSRSASDIERARFDCTAAGGRVVAFRLGSSAEMAQRY